MPENLTSISPSIKKASMTDPTAGEIGSGPSISWGMVFRDASSHLAGGGRWAFSATNLYPISNELIDSGHQERLSAPVAQAMLLPGFLVTQAEGVLLCMKVLRVAEIASGKLRARLLISVAEATFRRPLGQYQTMRAA